MSKKYFLPRSNFSSFCGRFPTLVSVSLTAIIEQEEEADLKFKLLLDKLNEKHQILECHRVGKTKKVSCTKTDILQGQKLR